MTEDSVPQDLRASTSRTWTPSDLDYAASLKVVMDLERLSSTLQTRWTAGLRPPGPGGQDPTTPRAGRC